MTNRREFLKILTAGSLGFCLFGLSGLNKAKANMTINPKRFAVGLQLYSIRDAMSTDPVGTLKKVSYLGYKHLELANYVNGKFYGYKPAEFKKIVSDLGMETISSQTYIIDAGINCDNAKQLADTHAELGLKYSIHPWILEEDRTIEKYKRMIGEWNKIGEILKNVGIQFGYHNHNFEFEKVNGIVPYYDLFLKEMDAKLITMEIDLFWAIKAGQNPVEMFKKYPGRFQLFHLKDMHTNEKPFYNISKDDIRPVGAGVIDFKRILAYKQIAGMKYSFVEDDIQGNGKPFESIGTSIHNLTTDILN